jgi:hypothetical protein
MKQSFAAAWAARALLLLLLIVVFVAAVFIAGASLHDPDTCWLLMLGKCIVESGALPSSDPYSYTMALFPEKRFVLYQWLTEVLFFLSYKALDLMGLLLLAAIVLTAAFVSIPLAFARKIGMPGTFAVIGTILTLIAAFFHFLCRPEIFSYLLIGVYISLTHFFLRNRKIEKTEKIDWKAVTIFGAVMMLWCNLHSAFVLGLGYLCVFAVITTLSDFIADKRLSAINQTGLLCFFSAFLATFINPYGAGLWQYLPTLFFTPLNKHILELRPLSGKDFLEWTYYPFFILIISSVLITARAFMSKIKGIDSTAVYSPRGQFVFAAIAILSWTIAGVCCRRLIPFAALHLFSEGGYMLALLRAQKANASSAATASIEAASMETARIEAASIESASRDSAGETAADGSNSSFLEMADRKIDSLYQPHGFMWFATIAVFAAVGVFFVATRIPGAVVLPQSGAAMQVPFDAIRFIADKPPSGRLFNEPQFGDVLIWKLPDPPKLFIDTRFDMYGTEIVDDFVMIHGAKPGWENLVKRYEISWMFVQPNAEIAKRLLAHKGWKILYQDKASIVMQRRNSGL